MKNITQEMLVALTQKLQSGRQPAGTQTSVTNAMGIPGTPINAPMNAMTLALMGKLQSPAESPAEIEKLTAALALLSSDIGYGSGRFYDSSGNPEQDYWLAGIWAIASLNWQSSKDIARNWSKQSTRYTEDGFEKAWDSYNPAHPNAIGIGSLYKYAMELGWNQGASQPQPSNSNLLLPSRRFTLLGINDLAALPPTEHLVKGILPSSGLAAIYGPSGSGKTFLALDLIMAIACQSDWFGHKVKNVPVTYVGLEGKGGINNRIQAWRIKNPSLTPANFKIILDNFDLMKGANVAELAQAIIAAQMHQGVIVIDTLNQASPAADENSSQDMGVIIKHLKLLQETTGGLVLIIHHTGKNTSQGLRGHSSLKAALDVNIEVVGGDKRSWLVEKSKDGEDGKSFGFRLEVQNLGLDGDGDPITSCTVERDHSVIFSKPEPSGKVQKAALKTIKQALSGTLNGRMTVDAGISEIAKTLTTIAVNKRNNRARQLLGGLTADGHLSSALINDEGWLWLP
jgi:archaellum biogenesis ATPase FlaH